MALVKTSVQLTEDQAAYLRRLHREKGIGRATVVRVALDRLMATDGEPLFAVAKPAEKNG